MAVFPAKMGAQKTHTCWLVGFVRWWGKVGW